MFDGNRAENPIPGYTGHIPKIEPDESDFFAGTSISKIPGYAGYISAVKSENLFGKTYGKITTVSMSHIYPKGADIPSNVRYTSTTKDAFIDQRLYKMKENELLNTIAEQHGVPKEMLSTYTFDDRAPLEGKQTLVDFQNEKKSINEVLKSNMTYEQARKLADQLNTGK